MPRGVYPKTKEHKRKISEARKGKPSNTLGKHWKLSKETKEKMSKTHWKGGKYKGSNRWFIYQPNHPFAHFNNYILRSRLVAEKCLSRYLEKDEIIHHINGKVDDDRPKNLYLFYSNSEHSHYEGLKEKPKLLSNLIIPS